MIGWIDDDNDDDDNDDCDDDNDDDNDDCDYDNDWMIIDDWMNRWLDEWMMIVKLDEAPADLLSDKDDEA